MARKLLILMTFGSRAGQSWFRFRPTLWIVRTAFWSDFGIAIDASTGPMARLVPAPVESVRWSRARSEDGESGFEIVEVGERFEVAVALLNVLKRDLTQTVQ